jgi:hypothetical protein
MCGTMMGTFVSITSILVRLHEHSLCFADMFTPDEVPDRDEVFSGNTGMIHTVWDEEVHGGALSATCLEGTTSKSGVTRLSFLLMMR